jgi:hypothetical protein
MTQGLHAVILVHSISHALRLEKLLPARGVACKMIPVPRRISSDCGVCVRVSRSDVETVRRIVAEARIEIEGVADI